jgi:hypothetical protein
MDYASECLVAHRFARRGGVMSRLPRESVEISLFTFVRRNSSWFALVFFLMLFPPFALASLLFLFVPATQCQILSVGDDTSTPVEGAGHDYIKMMSETVDPGSGSVSVRIQAPTAKGRGITLPFSFAYNSNGVVHLNPGVGGIGWASDNSVSSSLWSTTSTGPQLQTITCNFVSYYVFQDASGSRHNLGMGSAGWAQGAAPPYLCGTSVTGGGDQRYVATLLSSGSDGNTNPGVKVSDADGTVYSFATSGSSNGGNQGGGGALPSSIEDRNGNIITAVYRRFQRL